MLIDFMELFVQEADGDLKSRILLNILQGAIIMCVIKSYFFGIYSCYL